MGHLEWGFFPKSLRTLRWRTLHHGRKISAAEAPVRWHCWKTRPSPTPRPCRTRVPRQDHPLRPHRSSGAPTCGALPSRRPAAASPRRARERLPRGGPSADAGAHARPSASAAAFARRSGPASSPRLSRRMTSTRRVRTSRSNDPRAPTTPLFRVSESEMRVVCGGHAKHREDHDTKIRGRVETRPPVRTRATQRDAHRATYPSAQHPFPFPL